MGSFFLVYRPSKRGKRSTSFCFSREFSMHPVMKLIALGAMLVKDQSGMVALVSTSAWVREPYYSNGTGS